MKVLWKKEEKGRLKTLHFSNYWKSKGDWLIFVIPDICIALDKDRFEVSLSWLLWSIGYQDVKKI